MPSNPHPDQNGHERGRFIEGVLRAELDEARERGEILLYLQPDALVLDARGQAFLVEAKGQDCFRSPPFDGHGLPIAQLDRYEWWRAETGQPCLFKVYDRAERYDQWLHVLEAGDHFDTAGTVKTPRRIYPLSSFRVLEAA